MDIHQRLAIIEQLRRLLEMTKPSNKGIIGYESCWSKEECEMLKKEILHHVELSHY